MSDKVVQSLAITAAFRAKTIANHVDEAGYISVFPRKEKKKLVLLEEIMKSFSKEQEYTEGEINQLLVKKHDDYVAVRRYLIEYGFLGRTKGGERYWVI